MELKSIGPLSCAKVAGILYAVFGLLFGALFSLMAMLGASLGNGEEAVPGFLMGIGAIVILPIFYGVMGAISGLVGAFIYNLIARTAGGIKLEIS